MISQQILLVTIGGFVDSDVTWKKENFGIVFFVVMTNFKVACDAPVSVERKSTITCDKTNVQPSLCGALIYRIDF